MVQFICATNSQEKEETFGSMLFRNQEDPAAHQNLTILFFTLKTTTIIGFFFQYCLFKSNTCSLSRNTGTTEQVKYILGS